MQHWMGDWCGIAPESYPSFQGCSCWFRAAPKVTMTSHIGSQRDLFFIHFPLLSPYSPKPNHCGRIRRHLLDLVSINLPIMLRGQCEQHYFRDEIFPSMLGLLAKFLALPWILRPSGNCYGHYIAEILHVMSQRTGFGGDFLSFQKALASPPG